MLIVQSPALYAIRAEISVTLTLGSTCIHPISSCTVPDLDIGDRLQNAIAMRQYPQYICSKYHKTPDPHEQILDETLVRRQP